MPLADFYDALRAVITDTWPEVLPAAEGGSGGGIWHAAELATLNFAQLAAAGELPVVFLDGALRSSSQYGAANRVDAGELTIYYVRDRGAGGGTLEALLLPKLESLRTALMAEDALSGAGQVLGYPSVSCEMQLPANSFFLQTNQPYFAGAVIVRCVTGESA